ncbi:hypothetical protein HETIRDRAFT_423332 [Heterobasidion irregulare TC 32-1]|uniref:Uncharacterized protein n=1 Tax=Heterobasidion irregulare (strain TC 32-1) TaxID=747525 RepID=W4JM78_HETIT|nr:uncharacterized protein HETIRDRAFT_423332 [Heterobasidion irregulare TC 32-1]ETW74657.1 hypothetical protein HETIRDRAFT_423332 [Heterobasidion irregulare TC 32-1]
MFIYLLLHDSSRPFPGKPHALQAVMIAPYDIRSFVRVHRSTHDTGIGSSLIGKGTPVRGGRKTNAKAVISANSKFLHTSPPSSVPLRACLVWAQQSVGP